jgi:pimeloyl-ACP methyl ester carboxylesterase
MTITRLAGIGIDIRESGQGRPLLFLHGGGGLRGDEPFLALLAEGRRVIAPTHPGFGDSDLPDWMDQVGDIAFLYLDLLDRIGHAEVDVVGCSFGGWIAAELAVMVPHRIRGLVLVGPAGIAAEGDGLPDLFTLPEAEVAALLYHDPARYRRDPATLDAIEAATAWRDRQSFIRFARRPYLHNPKLPHRLHRATCPTLLMRGADDGLIPADHLSRYAEAFPDARVATIPGAGHLPQIEQPALFADLTLAFLRGEL